MKVSYLLAKFSGHRPCSSGVIMILVCHVISKDYVIKENPVTLKAGAHQNRLPILPSLVAIGFALW